jgi:chitinase
LRATLVSNLWTFITTNDYDGVDIDWEFPSSATDRTAFAALVEELRQALPQPSYLITLDVGPWGGTDTPFDQLKRLVDQFNIMMYDCAGPWTADAQLNSPIFWDSNNPHPEECQPGGSVADAADIYLNNLHIPGSKLNMGTPFYGYFYKTVGVLFGTCPGADPEQNIDCPDHTVRSVNYGTFIKQRVNNQGWVKYYDLGALVPYLLRADGKPGFITYDDSLSTYL